MKRRRGEPEGCNNICASCDVPNLLVQMRKGRGMEYGSITVRKNVNGRKK